MGRSTKLTLCSFTTVLVLLFAVGTTSANNLSISHGNLWTGVFRELSFSGLGIVQDVCSVTLEGSMHESTARKILETLLGYITRATVARPCIRGEASILTETLPWHVRYGGFVGILPRIEGVRLRIIGLALNARTSLGNCLMRSTEARPALGYVNIASYESGGVGLISAVEIEGNARIPCGSFFEGGFGGLARLREVPGGAENLLIKLI